MKIYISHESQAPAAALIQKCRMKLFPKIKELTDNSPPNKYGNDVEGLYIISACVSKKFLTDSGWKERNRYTKKDKSIDIRLNIDWEKFLALEPEKQYAMYFDHIIESIYQFGIKHPRLDFDYPKLIDDIKKLI